LVGHLSKKRKKAGLLENGESGGALLSAVLPTARLWEGKKGGVMG